MLHLSSREIQNPTLILGHLLFIVLKMKTIACVFAAASVVTAGIHEDCSLRVISDYYVDWCRSQCAEVQKTNPQCLGKQANSITDGTELAECVAELHFPHCRFLGNIAPPTPPPTTVECSSTCPNNFCGQHGEWQVHYNAEYKLCYYWNGTRSTWDKPF